MSTVPQAKVKNNVSFLNYSAATKYNSLDIHFLHGPKAPTILNSMC